MLRFAAGVFALLVACVCLADENPPLLLHQPTISATQIVFVYAGDLWSVPRAGGVAQRLDGGGGNGVAASLFAGWQRDRVYGQLRWKCGRVRDSGERGHAAAAHVSSGGG